VSIYLPTDRTGAQSQRDQIKLKNLIRDAEERMASSGVRVPDARSMLQPAQELLRDGSLWRTLDDGLALFISRRRFRHFTFTDAAPELVVVADRFHLKPLLAVLGADTRFYLLSVSQNSVNFYEASRSSVDALQLKDMPKSMEDALKYDDPEQEVRFRSTGRAGAGQRVSVGYGSGVTADEHKTNLLRFFHLLDDSLKPFLAGKKEPLVFAGVDYLFPIFKLANTYPNLMAENVMGNPESLGVAEIHKQAWSLIERRHMDAREQAAERYRQLAGTGKTLDGVADVVRAATIGRIDTLFVPKGVQVWGLVDEASGLVELHDEPATRDQDMLDLAAVQTLVNGGTLFTVDKQDVPGGNTVAAVLRY
jgi:hypothetical protein